MAELAAGPAATDDPGERARRQDRLQRAEAAFDPLPFEIEAARAYGRVYAAVLSHGRKPCRRLADLLIASTALAERLPLITRNSEGFARLSDLIEVVAVHAPPGD
jgi:predicted nucleic acid-binding protein